MADAEEAPQQEEKPQEEEEKPKEKKIIGKSILLFRVEIEPYRVRPRGLAAVPSMATKPFVRRFRRLCEKYGMSRL